MQEEIVIFLIGGLSFAVALNFLLTFRLAAFVRSVPEPDNKPFKLAAGTLAPEYAGTMLKDKSWVTSQQLAGNPKVLVFLSSGCQTCKEKLDELQQMRGGIEKAEISLWLIGRESEKQVKKFLQHTGLMDLVVFMSGEIRKRLNPFDASPFYIFIDGQDTVQASGYLGDENWISFQQQISELQSEHNQ